MIPGFSGHTMALLLILQPVMHNRQNFEQPLSKQIGNAVPPVLAWHVAKAIERFIEKNFERNRGLVEYPTSNVPVFGLKAA